MSHKIIIKNKIVWNKKEIVHILFVFIFIFEVKYEKNSIKLYTSFQYLTCVA